MFRKQLHTEVIRYPGQRIPRPERKRLIDIQKLEKGLNCQGLVKKFLINEPVTTKIGGFEKEVADKRLRDFTTNVASDYLSDGYRAKLTDTTSQYVNSLVS